MWFTQGQYQYGAVHIWSRRERNKGDVAMERIDAFTSTAGRKLGKEQACTSMVAAAEVELVRRRLDKIPQGLSGASIV